MALGVWIEGLSGAAIPVLKAGLWRQANRVCWVWLSLDMHWKSLKGLSEMFWLFGIIEWDKVLTALQLWQNALIALKSYVIKLLVFRLSWPCPASWRMLSSQPSGLSRSCALNQKQILVGWLFLKYTRQYQFSDTTNKETFDPDKYLWRFLVFCFENCLQFHYIWSLGNTCVSLWSQCISWRVV